jgi:hypothetical protein
MMEVSMAETKDHGPICVKCGDLMRFEASEIEPLGEYYHVLRIPFDYERISNGFTMRGFILLLRAFFPGIVIHRVQRSDTSMGYYIWASHLTFPPVAKAGEGAFCVEQSQAVFATLRQREWALKVAPSLEDCSDDALQRSMVAYVQEERDKKEEKRFKLPDFIPFLGDKRGKGD